MKRGFLIAAVLAAIVAAPATAMTFPTRKSVTAANAKANRISVEATNAKRAGKPVVEFRIVRKLDPRVDREVLFGTLIVKSADGKSFTFRGSVNPTDKNGEHWNVDIAPDDIAGALLTIYVAEKGKVGTEYEIKLGDFPPPDSPSQ